MNVPTAAPFSFTQVWDDTLAMLRANAGLLTAIAGVFLFLPALLMARYAPSPEGGADLAEVIEQFRIYSEANLPWLILSALVNMVGVIAIYLLMLAAPRLTVGRAVAASLAILPFYFIVTIGFNLVIGIGFLLLIVPGIYLLGRLVLASPVLVVEAPRSPGRAFSRAWELSRGRGWQIALLVVLLYFVASIVSVAVRTGIGSVVLLLLGNEVGGLIVAILEAAVGAAFAVLATVLIAAIYRAITTKTDLAKAST